MISHRLKELGLELAAVSRPLASYTPAKQAGDLIYVSGQLPLVNGTLTMTGLMTPERDVAEAAAAMETCFLNGLAAAASVAELDRITQVVRLGAFVASTPEFTEQHKVANGASDLAQKILGDGGVHARAAVGVAALPLNATVELELLFQVRA